MVSQVYVPDPAAVGQYMHSAAQELVRRGKRVVVFSSSRGYDNPRLRFQPRETLDGVEVNRLPLSSFGKSSMAVRLLGGLLFVFQVILRTLLMRKIDGVVVSTSPPMAGLAGVVLNWLRRTPIVFWAMDINPDQLVAAGKAGRESIPVRLFDWMNGRLLTRASRVVALDRFMAATLDRKCALGRRLRIVPPWPHNHAVEQIPHHANPFRRQHGLDGRFVFMYSGNLSLVHPLDTVLDAARRVKDLSDIVFLFVGGGVGREKIEDYARKHNLNNLRTLPYQPFDQIKHSLSAADVHLVSMGDNMVGIVHPCKVYGALAVSRPVLYLGPSSSHVGEIVRSFGCGWHVDHGDVDGAASLIRSIRDLPAAELNLAQSRAGKAVLTRFARASLLREFCDTVEGATVMAPGGGRRLAPSIGLISDTTTTQ